MRAASSTQVRVVDPRGERPLVSKGTLTPCAALPASTIVITFSCVKAPADIKVNPQAKHALSLGLPAAVPLTATGSRVSANSRTRTPTPADPHSFVGTFLYHSRLRPHPSSLPNLMYVSRPSLAALVTCLVTLVPPLPPPFLPNTQGYVGFLLHQDDHLTGLLGSPVYRLHPRHPTHQECPLSTLWEAVGVEPAAAARTAHVGVVNSAFKEMRGGPAGRRIVWKWLISMFELWGA